VGTVAISAAAVLVAAGVTTGGALYVGRRNRDASRRVAEFQTKLADTVTRRQLCLTLSSRALLVGERAAEIQSAFATFEQLPPDERRDEVRRRLDRLDLACDGFVESWVEVASWNLSPPASGSRSTS
jgi:hypothetical protein